MRPRRRGYCPSAQIAGCEDLGDIGHVVLSLAFTLPSFVELDVELFEQAVVLWVDEAHGKHGLSHMAVVLR